MIWWEYLSIRYDLDELKPLGLKGWELVTVTDDRMFFKRPLDASGKPA